MKKERNLIIKLTPAPQAVGRGTNCSLCNDACKERNDKKARTIESRKLVQDENCI